MFEGENLENNRQKKCRSVVIISETCGKDKRKTKLERQAVHVHTGTERSD
jgi:hypothetical protein